MAKPAFEDPALQDGTLSSDKALRKAAKEKKKAEKKAAKAAAPTESPDPDMAETKTKKRKAEDDVPAAGLSKEERKALKRAKKEQNGDEDDDVAKAERKAKRRAEKAAKKEQESQSITANDHVSSPTGGYQEASALSALPQSEIDAFVEDKQLTIEDPRDEKFRPITAFKYVTLEDSQRAPFAGFKEPTPIQAACWPYLLAGRDVVGVAETGSGKTLAFGMPCIRYISGLNKAQKENIKACIVSPTRELALQIQEQLVKVAEPAGLKVTCVYGGTNKDEQRAKLQGTHVVVATPGRLNDFVGEGSIDLSNVGYLVLDEADRMLDKGFEEEMRKIISSTPEDARQTLMFTATWPPSVRSLAETFMKKPVKVTIGDNASGELRANKRVTQQVEVVDQRDKQDRLFQLLKQYQSGKNKRDRILVFCLYKKEASRIEEFIRRKGFPVAGIHGDLNQQKRQESLEAFKNGSTPLLVATDVAARGLDIPAVKVVINVTFPLTAEDYVHRIGRTGRAGQDGLAITLFTENEKALSGALINVLKAAGQPVPEDLLKFGTTVKKKGHEAYGAFYKDTGDMPKAKKITFD